MDLYIRAKSRTTCVMKILHSNIYASIDDFLLIDLAINLWTIRVYEFIDASYVENHMLKILHSNIYISINDFLLIDLAI